MDNVKELDAHSAILGALTLMHYLTTTDINMPTGANKAKLVAVRRLMERGYGLFAEICADYDVKVDDAMQLVRAAEDELRWLDRNTVIIEEID